MRRNLCSLTLLVLLAGCIGPGKELNRAQADLAACREEHKQAYQEQEACLAEKSALGTQLGLVQQDLQRAQAEIVALKAEVARLKNIP